MINIIPYEPRYHDDFRRLNLEWLEKYGLVESHDLEILNDPEGTVINGGGKIFLASENDKIVGTAGMMKDENGEYELIKMGVDPDYRGRGISKLLIGRILEEVKNTKAKKIYLFSNSQLTTALNLYKQYGFQHVEVTGAPFSSADIKMELEL